MANGGTRCLGPAGDVTLWVAEPVGGAPERMDKLLTAERARWAEVVRVSGIERE